MRVGRRLAVFLLAIAGWNVVTYAMFIRNLTAASGRPTGYYLAHTGLIVVNLGIAVALAVIGVRAWRAASPSGPGEKSEEHPGAGAESETDVPHRVGDR